MTAKIDGRVGLQFRKSSFKSLVVMSDLLFWLWCLIQLLLMLKDVQVRTTCCNISHANVKDTLNLNIHFASCCYGINTWTVPSQAAVVGLFSKNNLKHLIDMNLLMANSRGKTAWAMYEAYAKEKNQAKNLVLFSFLSFNWAYRSKIHGMIEVVFFFFFWIRSSAPTGSLYEKHKGN